MEDKLTLFYSPFHTFVHKVLVTAHECGLWNDIVRVPTFPFKNNDGEDVSGQYSIAALNPLDKVPTLALGTGQIVYGSQAICELLDARSKAARMFPPAGPNRWDAITRMALSDTIFEMTVQMVAEQWNPPEDWRIETFERFWSKVDRAFDRLEEQAASGWSLFDIGHAAMLHALSYIGFRAAFYPAKDPVRPNFNWREGRPHLSAWYDEAVQRPSVTATTTGSCRTIKAPPITRGWWPNSWRSAKTAEAPHDRFLLLAHPQWAQDFHRSRGDGARVSNHPGRHPERSTIRLRIPAP